MYDALIASVKNEPRFIATFDRVRRRVAEMRARVDLSVIDESIARGARRLPSAEGSAPTPLTAL